MKRINCQETWYECKNKSVRYFMGRMLCNKHILMEKDWLEDNGNGMFKTIRET